MKASNTIEFNVFAEDLGNLSSIIKMSIFDTPSVKEANYIIGFFFKYYKPFSLSLNKIEPKTVEKAEIIINSLEDLFNSNFKINFREIQQNNLRQNIQDNIDKIELYYYDFGLEPNEKYDYGEDYTCSIGDALKDILSDWFYEISPLLKRITLLLSESYFSKEYSENLQIYKQISRCASHVKNRIYLIKTTNPETYSSSLEPYLGLIEKKRSIFITSLKVLYKYVTNLGINFGLATLRYEDLFKYQMRELKREMCAHYIMSHFSKEWIRIITDRIKPQIPTINGRQPTSTLLYSTTKSSKVAYDYVDLALAFFLYPVVNDKIFYPVDSNNFYNFINLRKVTRSIRPFENVKVKIIYLIRLLVNTMSQADGKKWKTDMLDRLAIDESYYEKRNTYLNKYRLSKKNMTASAKDNFNFLDTSVS